MLSEQYCRNLENTICLKQKQIRKLRNQKFTMAVLLAVGWSLFFVSQLRFMIE